MLRSLKYPLTLTPNGSLALSQDADTVREQIISALETRPGERIMLPLYGMRDRVLSALAPAVVVSDIENIIQRFVPLAKNVKVTYESNPELFEAGELRITVSYVYDGDNRSFSAVLNDGK